MQERVFISHFIIRFCFLFVFLVPFVGFSYPTLKSLQQLQAGQICVLTIHAQLSAVDTTSGTRTVHDRKMQVYPLCRIILAIRIVANLLTLL